MQELRKQKGLTQEQLAASLFVSRTAVSKWESGRGYPNIDSLRAIAKFFSVSLDDLLSETEKPAAVEEGHKTDRRQDMIFGLLDSSAVLILLLPVFAQKSGDVVTSVSLLLLNGIADWLKTLYFVIPAGLMLLGVMTLVLMNCKQPAWLRMKRRLSLIVNVLGLFLFVASPQPYAAAAMLLYLIIKLPVLAKQR